jgi:hypothetical protein
LLAPGSKDWEPLNGVVAGGEAAGDNRRLEAVQKNADTWGLTSVDV